MIDITPRSREILLSVVLLLCAGAAAAQDAAPLRSAARPAWDSAVRTSFLFHSCRTGRGLSLCLGAEEEAPSAFAARFDKLTRLAGMFMGRVQAVTLCGMRVRLKLDIL